MRDKQEEQEIYSLGYKTGWHHGMDDAIGEVQSRMRESRDPIWIEALAAVGKALRRLNEAREAQWKAEQGDILEFRPTPGDSSHGKKDSQEKEEEPEA